MTPEPFDPKSELAFVRAVLARQEAAIAKFEQRIRCVPRMLSALNGRRGRPLSEHDLADLVQDTVLIVLRKLDQFAAWAPLEAWIYRLCLLEFLNAIRRRGRERRRTIERVDEPATAPAASAGGHEHDDVHQALDRLGGVEAEAIRMKHFDALTFEEIGNRLGMPGNTAKTRYYRGLAKLAKVLQTYQSRQEHA